MKLDPSNIVLDLKVQDKYRQLLSQLGTNAVTLSCVVLGDSDIDYELGPNVQTKNRILSTPYNSEGIKYPLIYNGLGRGIKGTVTSFVRFVDASGNVSSYYSYPLNQTLTQGIAPPTLANGFNKSSILFTSSKMGAIIYFQTLLDYYRDENGIQQKIKEDFKFEVLFDGVTTVPSGWEVIIDKKNNSMFIGKSAISVGGTLNCSIGAIGSITGSKKIILFNK